MTIDHVTATPIALDEVLTDTWNRLTAAADDLTHPMRLHTVATVTNQGCPDARLLTLRGAQRSPGTLWYHSDVRARKITQMTDNHRVCTVTYDQRCGTQLRIWGTVSVHCDDELAHRHWEQLDLAVRTAYSLPHGPGEPLPHPDGRMRDHAAHDPSSGVANLGVIALHPDAIEWLRVLETGDDRVIMRADNDWRPIALVP